MTDRQLQESCNHNGYVVVRDVIDDRDLSPIRNNIKAKVDFILLMCGRWTAA